MIDEKIKNTYMRARLFAEECCITVEQDGKSVTAFSEFKGKKRVTDWGGTCSALELLQITGTSNDPITQEKIEQARKWLVNDQKEDGSWEAAEMQCSESTAAVLYDIYSLNMLSEEKQDLALKYVLSCYQDGKGYFLSCPDAVGSPHIYSSFLAVRALHRYGWLGPKVTKEILDNIEKSRAIDGNWGAVDRCREGDLVHTVMALMMLMDCGVSPKAIKHQYKKNVKWLNKQISGILKHYDGYVYEAIEVYSDKNCDEYGSLAHILKIYHYKPALLCSFFLRIGDYGRSYRLIEMMIREGENLNGWGINGGEKLFVWAAQQVVDCMKAFEDKVLRNSNTLLTFLRSITYKIPYFYFKVILTGVLIPVSVWLIKSYDKGPDFLIPMVFIAFPWIFKRED